MFRLLRSNLCGAWLRRWTACALVALLGQGLPALAAVPLYPWLLEGIRTCQSPTTPYSAQWNAAPDIDPNSPLAVFSGTDGLCWNGTIIVSQSTVGNVTDLATFLAASEYDSTYTYSPGYFAQVTYRYGSSCYLHIGDVHKGWFTTTIEAIEGGFITPAGTQPATACMKNCTVQIDPADNYTLYRRADQAAIVGSDLYIEQDYQVTGAYCGTPDAAIVTPPAQAVAIAGDDVEIPTSGIGSGVDGACANGGDPLNRDAVTGQHCTDMNLESVNFIKVYAQFLAEPTDLFNDGETTVNEFVDSSLLGQIVQLPASVLEFLNPPSVCEANVNWGNLSTWVDSGSSVVSICGIRENIDPFLNFGMYVLTVLAIIGMWTRKDA